MTTDHDARISRLIKQIEIAETYLGTDLMESAAEMLGALNERLMMVIKERSNVRKL